MLKPDIVTAFRTFLGFCSPNVNKPSPVLILIMTYHDLHRIASAVMCSPR